MSKGRLEAFIDGIFAILITIMLSPTQLDGKDSLLAKSIGSDVKGKISIAIYISGIIIYFFNSWVSFGLYCLVACIWFIPDKRIEKRLEHNSSL